MLKYVKCFGLFSVAIAVLYSALYAGSTLNVGMLVTGLVLLVVSVVNFKLDVEVDNKIKNLKKRVKKLEDLHDYLED